MTSAKRILQHVLLVLGGLFVAGLLLEGLLHFLPVNELLLMQAVNERQPVMRFAPDRTCVWSNFADFSMVNRVHSNNYGFLNDQDYVRDGKLPLVEVIGDSFVEAVMVPYARTLQGRLADALADRARVYSFGVSGAPLSQYLAYAGWTRDEFHPVRMIFVIVGNDFDESLVKYKRSPGLHFFRLDGDGFTLERVDYAPGPGVRLVTGSRLLMYLFTNADVLSLPSRLFGGSAPEDYVGQTEADAEVTRVKDSRLAVDEFFRRLPAASGLAPEDVLFVVDGMRPHLYSETGRESARGSYYDLMRTYFMQSALKGGYRLIDMEPLFIADYAVNGRAFEYERDGHWNGYAHGLVARSVLASGFLDGVTEAAR